MRTQTREIMAERITEKLVRNLPPPDQGNRITYDTEISGFGVRVTAKDAKSFIINYRADGRERRYTIGKVPEWSVSAAREEAKRLKREIDVGGDPMSDRIDRRESPSVTELCERYQQEHLQRKRPSSARNDRSAIRRFVVPCLGTMKVAGVRYSDVDALHRSMRDHPYQANRVLALLSKMFSLSMRWGWRSDNPCKGVERFPEHRRERFLSPTEIQRLAAALNDHPSEQVANVVRLLILTGARRGEVLGATWDQFDLERGVWTKPSAHTKQNKAHRVPLSAAAISLLATMKSAAGDSEFLFPSRNGSALGEIKKSWRKITEAADLQGLRLHDLRHTYASILASSGLSLPMIGALLGHTQPATTARYSHLMDDPLRAATEKVGSLFSALDPAEADSDSTAEIISSTEEQRR